MKQKKHTGINKIARQEKKHKHSFRKFIILAMFIAFFCLATLLYFHFYNFYNLAKEVIAPTFSETQEHKKHVDFSDIPEDVVDAYISIEDERFSSHHGVDIKRTGGAILSYILTKGNSSFGGSTITQQLVKNITGDDSNSIQRKVKEWGYSFLLETCFSKEKILEAYFNVIYTGPGIYGIGSAAHYYFNKDITKLSLAEAAFLAGLTHSPNSYNPFSSNDNTEKIIKRTKTVLYKMFELKYVSQEEYDSAVLELHNGLKFDKGLV